MSRLHITPGPSVVIRAGSAGERWCFGCRKRLEHRWELLDEPPERQPTYYAPTWLLRCSRCCEDHTAFPGCEPLSWEGPVSLDGIAATGRDPLAEAIARWGRDVVLSAPEAA